MGGGGEKQNNAENKFQQLDELKMRTEKQLKSTAVFLVEVWGSGQKDRQNVRSRFWVCLYSRAKEGKSDCVLGYADIGTLS